MGLKGIYIFFSDEARSDQIIINIQTAVSPANSFYTIVLKRGLLFSGELLPSHTLYKTTPANF